MRLDTIRNKVPHILSTNSIQQKFFPVTLENVILEDFITEKIKNKK